MMRGVRQKGSGWALRRLSVWALALCGLIGLLALSPAKALALAKIEFDSHSNMPLESASMNLSTDNIWRLHQTQNYFDRDNDTQGQIHITSVSTLNENPEVAGQQVLSVAVDNSGNETVWILRAQHTGTVDVVMAYYLDDDTNKTGISTSHFTVTNWPFWVALNTDWSPYSTATMGGEIPVKAAGYCAIANDEGELIDTRVEELGGIRYRWSISPDNGLMTLPPNAEGSSTTVTVANKAAFNGATSYEATIKVELVNARGDVVAWDSDYVYMKERFYRLAFEGDVVDDREIATAAGNVRVGDTFTVTPKLLYFTPSHPEGQRVTGANIRLDTETDVVSTTSVANGTWTFRRLTPAYLTLYYSWTYGGESGSTYLDLKDLNADSNSGGASSKVPIYRMYNSVTPEHLYTTSRAEYDSCGKGAYADWKAEGVAWHAPAEGAAGASPVWRLYNEGLGDHHYTASAGERDALVANAGWNVEGVAFYTAAKGSGAIGLYRLYNGGLKKGQHHYTASAGERDWLVANAGWKDEGVAFWGWGADAK